MTQIKQSSNAIKYNQAVVEASSEAITNNREAIETSTASLEQNKSLIEINTRAILENIEAIHKSSEAINQNFTAVQKSIHLMDANGEGIEKSTVVIKNTEAVDGLLNKIDQNSFSFLGWLGFLTALIFFIPWIILCIYTIFNHDHLKQIKNLLKKEKEEAR